METRLPNGKPALLLDIGSVGNLPGDEWVPQQAAMAIRAGLRPEQRRRERPLPVRGVGQGGEKCLHNCVLPVSLMNATGQRVTGTFDTPTVPRSQLPALLGLNAARESRMIIDTMRNTIYMAGLGEYDLLQALPPGTQQFNCILAPSGHMMIPCAEFPSSTAPDLTGRGRLQLTPQLAIPVEQMEVDLSAWDVSQELVPMWAMGPKWRPSGSPVGAHPEQVQLEQLQGPHSRRTRAVAYDATN